ncbi:PEP-CTERM-box response regulator transcription factor [Salinispirillum marinum]|uniref:PEP-CTERM-box response regulator transcription factor n=2 Tax=Saccharospirillaceae TaxID=255527 RepID=A0ABV8BD05_9GAMM
MVMQDNVILIIEDDEGLRSQLRWHFDDESTTILTVGDRESALAAVRQHEPMVVIQDLGLPPDPEGVSQGFRCMSEILSLAGHTKIIVLTGKGDRENALKAIELGAFDFYTKPVDPMQLDHVVSRAFHVAELELENRRLLTPQNPTGGLVTGHPDMLKVCRLVQKIAPSDVTCTFIGESGTGKEVLANMLHRLSERSEQPFIAINCAAIPENLMESELFGYEKGAFTGADKARSGLIEAAAGGTLFLDEIGDMPLALQAKLLRFLQERTIERVGGRKSTPIDVRVTCATNKNIEQMVAAGTFREDLYYRIAEMVIDIPPLRERDGDKAVLARHFLAKYAVDRYARVTGFSQDAVAAIEDYDWPGNVREMENKIKKAVILTDGKVIERDDLGLDPASNTMRLLNLRDVRQEAERKAIMQALSISNNNVSAAAKALGVTRPTLYDLLKKYHISADNPS